MEQCNGKWKVGWGVTARCNMRCPFCYSLSARKTCNDLPLETLTAFVDRNAAWIDSINYGTGENTLSDTWFSLVKYIRHKHPTIRQALTTNGYLCQALAQQPDRDEILASIDEVDVSIDYHESSRHIACRGHQKAFDWAIETIALSREKGIPTSIVVIGGLPLFLVPVVMRVFHAYYPCLEQGGA